MKKQQLTRRQIYSVTAKHIVYFGLSIIYAVLIVTVPVIMIAFGGNKPSLVVDKSFLLVLFIIVLPILLGFMSCFTYFIDIFTMNIKSIEEGKQGSKVLRRISHGGKECNIGVKIKVNSENEGVKKLIMYNESFKYDVGGYKSKYIYKKRYHYLALSKVVVYTEYVPIKENPEYNHKKNRKN